MESGRFYAFCQGKRMLFACWEDKRPVLRITRVVDVALSRFEVGQGSSPSRAIVGRAVAILDFDFVSSLSESSKGIGDRYALIKRESNPVGGVGLDGDGMLGRVDDYAFQSERTGCWSLDLVHLCHVQSVQRTSPSGAIESGAGAILGLDGGIGGIATQSCNKSHLQVL